MRRWVRLALMAAGSLAVVGCQRTGPVSLTHPSVLAKAGLRSYWQLKLQLLEDEKIERLFLLEESLYCLTNTNTVIAVDAARGVRKWTRAVAKPGTKVFPPCHGNNVAMATELPGVLAVTNPPAPETLPTYNLVFVNTPDYVVAFDRATGEVRRRFSFKPKPNDFVANTGGACDGTFFYIGSASGRCYGIRVNQGVISWILSTEDMLSAAPRCHTAGGSARVFVAGEDANYYVGKSNGLVVQVWPPAGQRTWAAMAGGVLADFHVDDRACFIPCANRRVYAFALSGGEPLWRFTCNGPLLDAIQVSQNSVFQYARGDKLYALNPANGELRWTMPHGRKVLAATAGQDGAARAYILGASGNLLVVDEILGDVRASIPLTGCELFAANTAAPAIYLASRSGDIYCLRQIGAEHLTAKMLMKNQPPEPEPEPEPKKP